MAATAWRAGTVDLVTAASRCAGHIRRRKGPPTLNTDQRDTLAAATDTLERAAEQLVAAADQTLAKIAGLAAEWWGATALVVAMSFEEGTWADITAVGGGPPRPLYELDDSLGRAAELAAILHAATTIRLDGDEFAARRTITAS